MVCILLYFVKDFWKYIYQHCFICRPPDSIVSEDAEIELRTVATLALAVRRSSHSTGSHLSYCILFSQTIVIGFEILKHYCTYTTYQLAAAVLLV